MSLESKVCNWPWNYYSGSYLRQILLFHGNRLNSTHLFAPLHAIFRLIENENTEFTLTPALTIGKNHKMKIPR